MKTVKGLLISIISLISLNLQATEPALPNGFIDTLNATYRSPSGSASANEVGIDGFGNYKNPKMTLLNENGLLVFKFEESQFELDISMFGITDAQNIDITTLNFHNDLENIFLSVEDIVARDEGFNTSLQSAYIDCKRKSKHEDITDDLLSACLTNSELKAHSGDFQNATNSFYSVFDNKALGDKITLDDLDIKVTENKLKASFKSNISKGVRVKIEGETHYDSEAKMIKIKIDKAKASFLNIKNTIFKELEQLDVEGLKVEKPYIYFSM